MRNYLKNLFYSVCLGFFASLIIVGFTYVIEILTKLIWEELPVHLNRPTVWPLVIGIGGGLIVGLLQKYVGPYPFSMEKSMKLPKQKTPDAYQRRIWRNFLNATVILVLGTGVGPEAALIAIVSELVAWISDRLKMTRMQADFWENNSMGTVLALIFRSPFFGLSEQFENESKQTRKWYCWSIYIITITIAWFIFSTLHRFIQAPVLYIRFRKVSFPPNSIVTALIAFGLALIAALLYLGLNKLVGLLDQWHAKPIFLGLLGGLVLGMTGMWTKFLLFSGESSLHTLLTTFSKYSGWTLRAWGFLKMVLAIFYNATGWRGGAIFPNIWGSICIGLGTSLLLDLSPVVVLTVFCAVMLTAIMKKTTGCSRLTGFAFSNFTFAIDHYLQFSDGRHSKIDPNYVGID